MPLTVNFLKAAEKNGFVMLRDGRAWTRNGYDSNQNRSKDNQAKPNTWTLAVPC